MPTQYQLRNYASDSKLSLAGYRTRQEELYEAKHQFDAVKLISILAAVCIISLPSIFV